MLLPSALFLAKYCHFLQLLRHLMFDLSLNHFYTLNFLLLLILELVSESLPRPFINSKQKILFVVKYDFNFLNLSAIKSKYSNYNLVLEESLSFCAQNEPPTVKCQYKSIRLDQEIIFF